MKKIYLWLFFIRLFIWGQKGAREGLWQGNAFLCQIYCLWRVCWKVSHLGVHPVQPRHENKKGQTFANCMLQSCFFQVVFQNFVLFVFPVWHKCSLTRFTKEAPMCLANNRLSPCCGRPKNSRRSQLCPATACFHWYILTHTHTH